MNLRFIPGTREYQTHFWKNYFKNPNEAQVEWKTKEEIKKEYHIFGMRYGKTQLLNDLEAQRKEGLQNIVDALHREYVKNLFSSKLVPNGDFDVEYISPAPFVPRVIWNDHHWTDHAWGALSYELMKGKWVIEKKEKKTMFFKKLRKRLKDVENMIGDFQIKIFERGGLKEQIDDIDKMLDKSFFKSIDCHTCGCVVRKEIAFRGHDRIERERIPKPITDTAGFYVGERSALFPVQKPPTHREVVYETWYCKRDKKGKKAYGSK